MLLYRYYMGTMGDPEVTWPCNVFLLRIDRMPPNEWTLLINLRCALSYEYYVVVYYCKPYYCMRRFSDFGSGADAVGE